MISLGDVELENKDTMESSLHILNEGVCKTHNNRNHEKWKFSRMEGSSHETAPRVMILQVT